MALLDIGCHPVPLAVYHTLKLLTQQHDDVHWQFDYSEIQLNLFRNQIHHFSNYAMKAEIL